MAFQQLHLQTAGLVSVVQFCQTFWPREADFNDALEMMQWWGARVEGLRLAGRQTATSEPCPVWGSSEVFQSAMHASGPSI